MKTKALKLLTILIFIIGIFMAFMGIYNLYIAISATWNGINTSGTIVSSNLNASCGWRLYSIHKCSFVRIQYIDYHNYSHIFGELIGYNPKIVTLGQKVNIIYDRNNPQFAVIADYIYTKWILGFISLALGLYFTISIVFERLSKRRK